MVTPLHSKAMRLTPTEQRIVMMLECGGRPPDCEWVSGRVRSRRRRNPCAAHVVRDKKPIVVKKDPRKKRHRGPTLGEMGAMRGLSDRGYECTAWQEVERAWIAGKIRRGVVYSKREILQIIDRTFIEPGDLCLDLAAARAVVRARMLEGGRMSFHPRFAEPA